MRGLTIIAAGLMLTAALILSGCSAPSFTFRYKLTLEALIDGQLKSAFSIADVSYALDIDNSAHGGVRGEALYFDLGPGRRPLIALLSARPKNGARHAPCQWGENGPGCLHDLYGTPELRWNGSPTRGRTSTIEFLLTYMTRRLDGGRELLRQRGPRPLPLERLPDLVTFEDVTDPKSVLAVDPKNPGAALEVDFEWKRITLEITDEPLTTGIEKRLGWLVGLKTTLAGKTIVKTNDLADNLGLLSFKSGSTP